MKKSDFYYDLPKEYIAQTPIEPRDASKMMVINRKTDVIEDKHFYDIVDYLNEGDCLILNNTKVLPARMYGVKKDTGAVVEFLLLNQKENDVWEVITGPGKKAREGSHFSSPRQSCLLPAEECSHICGCPVSHRSGQNQGAPCRASR